MNKYRHIQIYNTIVYFTTLFATKQSLEVELNKQNKLYCCETKLNDDNVH